MTRSRNKLHVSKLMDFAAFCERRGWRITVPKGEFEVLRMRHPTNPEPLIVHTRIATGGGAPPVHLTAWGESERLLKQFLKENTK